MSQNLQELKIFIRFIIYFFPTQTNIEAFNIVLNILIESLLVLFSSSFFLSFFYSKLIIKREIIM